MAVNTRQAKWGGFYAWEFEKDGRELRVRVEGQLSFKTSISPIDAAVEECGFTNIPDLVKDHWAP